MVKGPEDVPPRRPTSGNARPARAEALEKRVLFSADLPWVNHGDAGLDAFEQVNRLAPDERAEPVLPAQRDAYERPMLVIDRSLVAAQSAAAPAELQARLAAHGVQTHVVEPHAGGIDAISSLLAERAGVGPLAIATTASSEGIRLGNETLSVNGVLNSMDRVAAWREHLGAERSMQVFATQLQDFEDREHFSDLLGDVMCASVRCEQIGSLDELDRQVDYFVRESPTPAGEGSSGEMTQQAEDMTRELVFIDPRADDYESLVQDIRSNAQGNRLFDVILLDANADGMAQIQATLAEYTDIDAVHIISHGTPGSVQIGGTWLNPDTLDQHARSLAAWGGSLAEDADLLFYGCDFAATAQGRELLREVSTLTGADVAASDDATGHQLLQADWHLEYVVGEVETAVAVSSAEQATYAFKLAAPVVDLDGSDSAGVNLGTLWTQGGGPVPITDTDATITDASSSTLASLTVTITNARDGAAELLAANTAGTSISASYDAGTNTLSLTGTDTVSNYQQVLRTLTYDNTHAQAYGGEPRTIEFVANDGSLNSAVATTTVSMATDYNVVIVSNTSDATGGDTSSIGALIASDGGDGISLREAIIAANNTANTANGADVIRFDIAGAGPHTITLGGALPQLTAPVVIDGTSEPDFAGQPNVILDGNGSAAIGLDVTSSAGGSRISGLVIRDFTSHGIHLRAGADGNVITGNYIGQLAADGTDAGSGEQNGGDGIRIESASNTIGGTDAADRNVISGNDHGVHLTGAQASNNVVLGNYMGTDGTGASAVANRDSGVAITSGANLNTIGGGAAGARNVLSGNALDGVLIEASSDNVVLGNYIGTDVSGVVGLGNGDEGVDIGNASTNNTIGGTGAGEGNVIADSGTDGVDISDVGTTGNRLLGNYIGVDATGLAALGNGEDGVEIQAGATGNIIGGSAAGAGNVISANANGGITIKRANTNGNILQGNYIGLDATGTAALGNDDEGVDVRGGASNNVIGGTGSGEGNIISGNNGDGVVIRQAGTDGNTVQGNYIGLNASGTAAVSNGEEGVDIRDGATNTTVGGTASGAGNVISGNSAEGVIVEGSATTNTLLLGNRIGTNATGDGAIGNARDGVLVRVNASVTIGGVAAGAGNLIAFNGQGTSTPANGVTILSGSTGTAVRGNAIYGNTGLGIDLAAGAVADGESTNDAGDADSGGNNLQNWAVLHGAAIADDGTFTYELDTTVLAAGTYTVDFYASTDRNGGEIQAERYLGTATGIGDGNPSLTGSLSGITLTPGEYVTLLVTDAAGNTSEFSNYAVATDADPSGAIPEGLLARSTVHGGLQVNVAGTNDTYLQVADAGTLLGGLANLSLDVQFSAAALSDEAQLVSYATASNGDEISIAVRDLGATYELTLHIAGASTAFTFDGAALFDGERQTLTVDWSNAAGDWTVYADALVLGSGTGLATGQTLEGGGTLVFAHDQDAGVGAFSTPSSDFDATLYDIRLFDASRAIGDIFRGVGATLPYDEANMIANWRFDQVSRDEVLVDAVAGRHLSIESIVQPAFTDGSSRLTFAIAEGAADGSSVGVVLGTDAEREALISSLLADHPDLRYDAQTDSFYRLASGASSWTQARSDAANASLNGLNGMGGQLATIRSAAEQNAVQTAAAGNVVWLGATDADVEGVWRWVDTSAAQEQFWSGGVTGGAVDGAYTQWAAGNPDNGASAEHYLFMAADGTWSDGADSESHQYVVQWDAQAVLDATQPIAYSIFSQPVPGAFAIDGGTGEISVADGTLLDFESQPTHTLVVETADIDGNSAFEWVTISVTDELSPVVEGISSGAPAIDLDEDTTHVFSAATGNAITVSDDGAADRPLTVTLSVSNGTLALAQTTGLSFPAGADRSSTITISGLESDLNAALDGLTYRPDAAYAGSDTLTVTTSTGGRVGEYTFEGGSAANSAPGTTGDGTLESGATTTVDGQRGDVLSLDGTGAHVNIESTFGNPATVTLAGWVNLDAADTDGAEVISIGGSALLRLDATDGVTGTFWDGTSWHSTSTDLSVAGTGWRHVAYVIDDVNDLQRVYIDGVLAAQTSASASISYDLQTNTRIGAHPDDATNTVDFDGLLDDVHVYTEALTSQEIAALVGDSTGDTRSQALTISSVNDAPTFASGVGYTTNHSSAAADSVSDLLVYGDGALLTVGAASDGAGPQIALSRYDTQGNLDPTFGSGGRVTTAIGTQETVHAAALQPDGRILVVGGTNATSPISSLIVRYNADGSLDTSFGAGGVVTQEFSATSSEYLRSVVVQEDGKILAAGYANSGGDEIMTVIRLNADGSLDTTFDGDGMLTIDIGAGDDRINDLVLQDDGRIIAAGQTSSGSNWDAIVLRLNHDGSLDTSFAGTGYTTLDVDSNTDSAAAVALDDSGRIVFGGTTRVSGGSESYAARLNADGSFDSSFNGTGVSVISAGSPHESITSLTLQSDGKVLLAGSAFTFSGINDVSVIRLNTDGTLDTSWAGDGTLRQPIGTATDDVSAIAVDGEGNVIVAGRTDDGKAGTHLMRFDGGGNLDERFVLANTLDGTPTFVEDAGAVVLDSDVKIYDEELSASDDFGGASLTLSRNGGANAEDVFSATGNLAIVGATLELSSAAIGSVSNSGGQLAITFSAGVTRAQVNEAMQSIAYANSSDTPPASVQIDWRFDDGNTADAQGSGGAASVLGSTVVSITSANDTPVVASVEGSALSYTEGDGAVAVSNALTLSDADDVQLASATVRISLNYRSGEDVLAFIDQSGITGSWDSASGTLTLTGSATVAQYQTALRSITYTNSSQAPDTSARSITFTVNDGTADSNTSARSVTVAGVNDAPTGAVTIDDTSPAQGDTLTASNTLADADGISGAITYQWQRDGVNIAGATASTYTTTQDDVGAAITVVASYTDDQGTAESVASGATAAVTNVNDAPTGSVSVDNTNPAEGDTLTASNTLSDEDGISGAITYQWQRDGVNIAGATGSAYTTTQADVGAAITVVASYTDDQGAAESVTSAATSAVTNVNDTPTGAVSVDNSSPAEGDTLTASNTLADEDGLSGAITYQWQRDGVNIVGATGSTYTTTQDDVGAALAVVASYTDDQGTAESVASGATAAVTNVNDTPTGSVSVDNASPAEGDTLTASNTLSDEDGISGAITYQWQRDGVNIVGASGSTYTTAQDDVGAAITVVASYTDDQGAAESVASGATAAVTNVNDTPTGSVSVDNANPAEGDTLTASNTLLDEDGISGAITYQWQRDGVNIVGATGSTYTTTQDDVGAAIAVVASYTDDQGAAESVASGATAAVTNVNDTPTGSVSVDNASPAEGDTLTASNTLSDEDGISGAITYQWQRDGLNILGATGTTYTTTQSDVGAVITVVTSYTDDQGAAESVTSAATSAVTNVNDAPTGAVSVDNTSPAEGDTLTASNTLADEDGISSAITYQWQRGGVNIVGATGATYATTQDDVGAAISVVASFTDDQGAVESVSSAATAAVTNVNDGPTGSVSLDNANPAEGDTLTASNTLADEDGISGAITYQWQRDGVNIVGATGATYATTQDDVGAAISVVASFTDDQGAAESVSSAATAAVTNVNDAPTGSVSVDNTTPTEGDTLTASNTLSDEDGISGAITYQWQRDGVNIVGATGSTYTTTQGDVGATIAVVASYTDDQGAAESVTSGGTAAVTNVNDTPTGSVSVDNANPAEGDTLTASNTLSDADGMSGAVTYQWQRDGANILGATGSTYTTVQADVGAAISVVASYTDDQGAAESVTSVATAAVTNVNDGPTGSVSLDNTTPAEGDTLTASNTLSDEDGISGAITYQWQRDGVDIVGATGSTYTTTQDDVGAAISVAASYTDAQGTAESVASGATSAVTNVNDTPTGSVSVDNANPVEGDTLTASNTLSDEDGMSGAVTYQWQRDGANILGATGATYTTTQADVGAAITVVASYTDDQGAAESMISAATSAVTNVNDTPTGAVSLDNVSPAEGDTLTASNTLADEDGVSGAITYQWQRDGIDIVGAVGSTYTTTQDDVGAAITVVASYTDDQGAAESVASGATAAVANVNDTPTGSVTVDNTNPAEGDTLTASNTLADGDGISGAVTYQWQRDGMDITGATGSAYTTTQDDVGAAITAVASFTDDQGAAESVSSAATSAVTNVNDAPAGSVSIDNANPAEGDTLTAANTLSDEDGMSGAITYQWQRDGVSIAGATGSAYTTTQADVGAAIAVVASFTDDQGAAESMWSAATSAVTNVNDAPTGLVSIDNASPAEGDTLTASNTLTDEDGVSGAITYQWQRDGVNILGATGSAYIATQDDVGAAITVVASFTDDQGAAESVSSAATWAVTNVNDAPAGSVSIDNANPAEGDTLTASNTLADGDGIGGAITYEWQRDGMNIAGATGSTYTTTQADVGAAISVVASYTDDQGTAESITSIATSAVTNVNDTPTGSVSVDNASPAEGDTLTASNTLADEDGISGAITYQWQRDGVDIVGATGSTYTTTQDDVGAAITVVAAYTDVQGAAESETSSPTAAVTNLNNIPTGTVSVDNANPTEGDTLTALNTLADEDGMGGTISYQWQRNGVNIAGATGSTYTTGQADVAAVISVVASYTDDQGAAESISSVATAAVTNVNDTPMGAVSVDNTSPAQGDTLTATNTLTDEDGISGAVTYQWQRNGVDIVGATGDTYETTRLDVGQAVRVVATFTDDQGTVESVASTATAPVLLVNAPPVAGTDVLQTREDEALVFSLGDLSAMDPDGESLMIVSVGEPSHGTLTQGESGRWTYVPNADFNGLETLRYVVADVHGAQAIGTLQIEVVSVNDSPSFETGSSMEVNWGQWRIGAVQATDADGDALTYSITGGDDAKSLKIDANTGQLSFIGEDDGVMPGDQDADQVFDLQITVRDGAGSVQSMDLQVRVIPASPTLPPLTPGDGGNPDVEVPARSDHVTLVSGSQINSPIVSGAISGVGIGPSPFGGVTFELSGGGSVALFPIVRADQSGSPTVTLGTYDLSGAVSDDGADQATAVRAQLSLEAVAPLAGGDGTKASVTSVGKQGAQMPAHDHTAAGEQGLWAHLITLGESAPDVAERGEAQARPSLVLRLQLAFDELQAQDEQASDEQEAPEGVVGTVTEIILQVSPELQGALEQLQEHQENSAITVKTAGTAMMSISLSAGFVTWMMRAGSLLASMLATRPIWTELDPLPIFATADDEEDSAWPGSSKRSLR